MERRKSKQPKHCVHCGTKVHFRELPSGRMLAYDSANDVHRCDEMRHKPDRPPIEWVSPLMRRSVVQWSEVGIEQYVLVLPNKEELVIRLEQGQWYVEGRIEGAAIPSRFFEELPEAVVHAEKYLMHLGQKLMTLLLQEDRRKDGVATPIQRSILRNFGHLIPHNGLSRHSADKAIRQYVRYGQ